MDSANKRFIWIGLSIPLILVLLIFFSIYIPKLRFHPQYNFIYSLNEKSYDPKCKAFLIKDGKLTEQIVASTCGDTTLYYYDIKQNTSQPVSYEQARQYTLDANPDSPDGYRVFKDNGGSGFFPLFYDNTQSIYLSGHGVSGRVNIPKKSPGNYQFYYAFQFLGWVKEKTGG